MYDEKFMRRAIELSAQALDTPGARPYGAVVVKDGKIVGEGLNQSAKNFDPTSHGEVEAVRDACRNLKTTDLSGAELYTSCEPCSVCVATMIMAGIGRMYYGAIARPIRRRSCRAPTMPPPALLVREQVGLPWTSAHAAGRAKLGDEAIAVLKPGWRSRSSTGDSSLPIASGRRDP